MSTETASSRTLSTLQPALWLVALAFYGVGDTVTTGLGLRAAHAEEVGPLALIAIDAAGLPGLVVLKLVFLGLAFGVWAVLDRPSRVAIPLAIAVAGIGVTTWNLFVLVG